MPAIALTDHANLMGSFRLIKQVKNYNKGLKIAKLLFPRLFFQKF